MTRDHAVRPTITTAPAEVAHPEPVVAADRPLRAGPLWQALALGVRPKLAVSTPGDPAEREADAVADRVTRMPAHQLGSSPAARSAPPAGPPIQGKRRAADGSGTGAVPAVVEGVLTSAGEPLSAEVRAFMEPRFGHDFGHVRIHTDAAAAAGADAIAARAFTHGHRIAFARGEYEPASGTGRQLLAHELAHVLQQASGAGGIDRAVHQIGSARISIDYGDVVGHDSPAEHQQQIEGRYTALTGKPGLDVSAAVAALTNSQRRWLVFALDLLADNPLPGLDLGLAVRRLIDYAPNAAQHPLGPTWREFATEAMRASGWLELALTVTLKEPGKTDQDKLNKLYNPTATTPGGSSSSACPANRPASDQLDEPTLRAELDTLMRTYVSGQASAVRARAIDLHDVSEIRSVADAVQAEALRFFAPYIGHSHTRAFQQSWRYSSHLTPSTAPGAIPAASKRAFLDNRARNKAGDAGLLARVHHDPRCDADELVFADIIDKLAADASVQADLDAIMSWKTFTASSDDSAEVTMNLQYSSATGACEARWMAVESLCHELMHVYVSQEFFDLHRNRLLITEGFPEILGDQLYEHIREIAEKDTTYRKRFEPGLPAGACPKEIRAPERGYPSAASPAEEIRGIVGDDRFRAAYFLGRTRLAGLQPKLRVGALDDPLERQADAVAARALAPGPGAPATRHANGAAAVRRQPVVQPTPQDRATVERAKARLKVLEPLLGRLKGRQVEIEAERLRALADRKALDEPDPTLLVRAQREELHWSRLNIVPVTIVANEAAIVFQVRFHVRFEDPTMKGRFAELRSALQAGIDLVWKKELEGVFAGRTFTVVPQLTLIDAATPRDQSFWLITVRKVSTGVPVTYPGCTLEKADPRFPTSVTDPMCDGGVMSIPPAHITKAGVLGHELMHLFGLVDRYMLLTSVPKAGKPTFTLVPARETPGRHDPLGGDDATILREDLGYLFSKLGLYQRESDRQTAGLSSVETEVRRLRRIVELGYDPDSLVRSIAPKDFSEKVIKSAEDL
jgi:hypothetical protein